MYFYLKIEPFLYWFDTNKTVVNAKHKRCYIICHEQCCCVELPFLMTRHTDLTVLHFVFFPHCSEMDQLAKGVGLIGLWCAWPD